MRKLLIPSLLVLSACSEQPAPSSPVTQAASKPAKIELNLASPDQALKTWWKVRDLSEVDAQQRCKSQLGEFETAQSTKYTKGIATGAALAGFGPSEGACELMTYSRDITEVKVESETRAVILARVKPATPLPAGVVLTASQAKGREEGERFKYVLEKVGAEWKMAQMYRFADYGDDPWKPVFEEVRTKSPHYFVYGAQ